MTRIKQAILKGGLASAALLTAVTAHSVTLGTFNNTTVKVGGYVKLDVLYSSYDAPYTSIRAGRDFYIPSTTPVSSPGTSSQSYFDMHARQTRVHLATDTKLGEHKLKTYIEIDFMLNTPPGDERISNSYAPRMRHAYLVYDNWLFGQTWTTFQNVSSLPETVDFIGNTDAGIFVRQPQIRYTHNNWQFSIENPETTVTPNSGGTSIITADNTLPDFVGRYNWKNKDLSLVGAVLVRQLTMDQSGVDDSTTGIALSFTGKYMLKNKDDIRFGINTGSGMGRYIGLNVANGAVVDNNGKLETIDSTAFFGSYRHLWNQKWRSNITYSRIDIDNNATITGGGVNKSSFSTRVNLFYSAAKNLSFGGEFAHANLEKESGTKGDLNRLQFMAMLKF